MARRPSLVHSDFEAAFTKGNAFRTRDGKIPMRQIVVGNLVAPSGKIIACDPMALAFGPPEPFRRVAPRGTHTVLLAIAKFKKIGEVVACARIQFARRKPVRWELATKPGQKLSELGPDEVYGFGVDGGTGCFVDDAAITMDNYEFYCDADNNLTNALGRDTTAPKFGAVIYADEEQENGLLTVAESAKLLRP
jgi:hypothetical protein